MTAERRLQELGITLPEPAKPVASYVPATESGKLLFVAGQIPLRDGKPVAGRVGPGALSTDEGAALARQCALQALAIVRAHAGSLDRVARVPKVAVYVAAQPGFGDTPKVANGASDLLVQVFGEAGRHARTTVGVFELPLGVPVEVELTVELA